MELNINNNNNKKRSLRSQHDHIGTACNRSRYKGPVSGPLRPPSGLVIFYGDSEHSAYVLLVSMIYYSEKIQNKISKKKKGAWGKVQRKPGARFQESFPRGVTQDVLSSPSNEL